jgi:hypothetical protein
MDDDPALRTRVRSRLAEVIAIRSSNLRRAAACSYRGGPVGLLLDPDAVLRPGATGAITSGTRS